MTAARVPEKVPILTLKDVRVQYDEHCVLAVQEFELFPGELVLIRGSNGSGKSSLLNGLAGIGPILHGEVRYCNADIGAMPAFRRSRMGLRLLPQGRRVFDRLNAREHVRLAQGCLDGRRLENSAISANLGRIWDSKDPLVGASGGEAKSILLASLLTTTTRLVMLDEPFAGLDQHGRAHLMEQIESTRVGSVGWIVVDHTGTALEALQRSGVADIQQTSEGNTLHFSREEGGRLSNG